MHAGKTGYRQRGFALLEILIALVILGGGLLGLARLQLGMLGGSTESVLYDGAVRLAEDQLELMRFDLAAGKSLQAGSDAQKIGDVPVMRHWTWAVNALGLGQTTVTVSWRDPTTGVESALSLPGLLQQTSLAAQGWLIQSGPPSHETLP